MEELKEKLDDRCVAFDQEDEKFQEELAMCGDELLEQYMEERTIEEAQIRDLIRERGVFPLLFWLCS